MVDEKVLRSASPLSAAASRNALQRAAKSRFLSLFFLFGRGAVESLRLGLFVAKIQSLRCAALFPSHIKSSSSSLRRRTGTRATCNFRSTHPLIQTLLQFLINNFILISINYQRERAFVEQKRDSEESEEMEVFQRPWLCGGPKVIGLIIN